MKKLSKILSVVTIVSLIVLITFSCKKDNELERLIDCSVDELAGSYQGHGTYKDYHDTAHMIEEEIESIMLEITRLTESSIRVRVETSNNFSKTFSGSFYDTYNLNFYSHPHKLNFSVWKDEDGKVSLQGYVGEYLSDTTEIIRTTTFDVEKQD